MKDCLSAPALGWKNFNSMRTEEDEPIYTYNDKYMRWFVRQSIKGGRVCSFNWCFRSKNCDEILKISSKDLNVKKKVYDISEAYMKYKNHSLKTIKEEYESKYNDYRDIDEEELENYMNKKSGEVPIHKLLQELSVNDLFRC